MRHFLITCLCFLPIFILGQKHTISGYLKDKQTGEVLIGASIYDKNSQKGTSTNAFGFYSLTLPQDSVDLVYSAMGYKTETMKFYLSKNRDLTLELELTIELDEITITSENRKRQNEVSTIKITAQTIKTLPSLAAEKDIFKTMQLMPGVQTSDEGSSAMIVRGGSPDQNLILLDDIPLYYVNHLGGFLSVFNPYSIKSTKLIKGGFPAEYGGRLSSVVDIRTKDGNLKKTADEVELGLISEKISIEGPIIKDKLSYIVSVRKGMLDLYLWAASSAMSQGEEKAGYNLFDTNIKFNFVASKKSRFSLSFYRGFDRVRTMYSEGNNDYSTYFSNKVKWGNTAASLRWNKQYSKKLFGNITFAYINYKYGNNTFSEVTIKSKISDDQETETFTNKFYSQITDFNLKTDFDYSLNNYYKIKFGANAIHHIFEPGVNTEKIKNQDDTKTSTISSFVWHSNEISTYLENKFSLKNKHFINLGIRALAYSVEGKTYTSLEPRISASLKIINKLNLKTSYAKTQQHLHLLTSNNIGNPADMWLPSTNYIPPQEAHITTLGFFSTFSRYNLEFSAEAFYKKLSNLTTLKEGQSLVWNTKDWQDKIDLNGVGKVYGIEFLLRKSQGKLTGWIAYTWSRNRRQFENQNHGREYPYTYDRTHDFSIVGMYKLNKKISFSANWVYTTGKAITFAQGKYYRLYGERYYRGRLSQMFIPMKIYNVKNNLRMPAVHHLDISVNFTKQKKRGIRTWNISVYNVYNRKNPYMYFYKNVREKGKWKMVLKKLTLFPILPSVSYSFKF